MIWVRPTHGCDTCPATRNSTPPDTSMLGFSIIRCTSTIHYGCTYLISRSPFQETTGKCKIHICFISNFFLFLQETLPPPSLSLYIYNIFDFLSFFFLLLFYKCHNKYLAQQTSRPLPPPRRIICLGRTRPISPLVRRKPSATGHGRGKHPRGRQGRGDRRLPLRRLHAAHRHPVVPLLLFLIGRRQPEGVHDRGGRLGHPGPRGVRPRAHP
jgi:hypothetical protein